MKISYAPRVSMSYVELSELLKIWSESCESIIVFEHDKDEEIQTTHCHILMLGTCYATAEPFKRKFHEIIKTDRKGNELWSWFHKDFPVPDLSFIRYMGKGSLRPSYYAGRITIETIMEYVGKWTDHTDKKEVITKKPQGEFDVLLLAAEAAIKAKKLTVSMSCIACFIKSHYLRNRKAVPRKSDTNRYAYSIYAIVSGTTGEADIEKIDRQALIENIEF